jgi:hypothetical protein
MPDATSYFLGLLSMLATVAFFEWVLHRRRERRIAASCDPPRVTAEIRITTPDDAFARVAEITGRPVEEVKAMVRERIERMERGGPCDCPACKAREKYQEN